MFYEEYKEAAIKHLQTCRFMVKHLENIYNIKETERITASIYYLSGYVVECILSYTIFYLIRYDSKKSVYELDNFNGCGLKFNKNFRTHKFDEKLEYIRRVGGVIPSNLPIIGNIQVHSKIKSMFDEWKPEVRYTTTNLSFTISKVDTINFIKTVENIYNGLRRI